MTDGQEQIFVRELHVRIPFETYQDPEQEPENRTRWAIANDAVNICERLFGAVQRLAYFGHERPIAFDVHELFETLETIGLVGRSIAAGASEEVDRLNQIIERAHEGARHATGGAE
ncbi:MAG TPA: hypothetical protein VNZ44_02985 [Pyrinomonadaceae bacterium]|nr:hypothetical protein [Pyrinomonadaceae bacterium]